MKMFLFLFFATQCAYCEVKVPTSKAEAIALVIGMKSHLADAKAETADVLEQLDGSLEATAEADKATVKVQGVVDTRTQERDEARAEAAVQRKWKWRWFGIAVLEGLILGVLAYLKLKP